MFGEIRCWGGCLWFVVKIFFLILEILMDYFNIFGEVVGVEIKMDVLMGCLRLVLILFCIFIIVNWNFSWVYVLGKFVIILNW